MIIICLRIMLILICSFSLNAFNSNSISQNFLTIPLKGIGNSLYVFSIDLGTPPQTFNSFGYDITAFNTYVNGVECSSCKGNRFNYSNSGNLQNNGIFVTEEYALGIVNGDFHHVTLKLGNYTTIHNSLIISNEVMFHSSRNMYEGIVGFGLNYSQSLLNLNNSIFDKFLEKISFSNRILSQKIVNESYGELILGQIPNEIFQGKMKHEKCKLIKDDAHWGCTITHLAFGDQHTSLDSAISIANYKYNKTYFSTAYTNIILPEAFLKLFLDFYFKKQIGKTCFTEEKKEDSDLINIRCERSVKEKFKNIHFIFNEVSFKIPVKDLFSHKNEKTIIFNILFHKSIRAWYIGQIFLKNYLVVFDATNEQIGFYGNEINNYKYTSGYFWFLFFFSFIIFVIVTIFIYIKISVNSNEENYIPFHIPLDNNNNPK
jgi:hypothetical protein